MRKMTQFSDHYRCLFVSFCCFLQHRLTSSSLCSSFLPWHHGESGAHDDVRDLDPRPTPGLRVSLRSSAEELSEGQHLKQFKCQTVKFFLLKSISNLPFPLVASWFTLKTIPCFVDSCSWEDLLYLEKEVECSGSGSGSAKSFKCSNNTIGLGLFECYHEHVLHE